MPSIDVIKELKSSLKGITQKESEKRLKEYGRNVLVEDKNSFWLFELLAQFKDPMIIILLIAAIVSAFIQEVADAIIIVFIVILSTVLDFYQERKAGNAARKLQEHLSSKAKIIRSGKIQIIEIKNICIGDIISLEAGDLIPADARVISCKDFFVNQSALTGESFPVEKTGALIKSKKHSFQELDNIILTGTNVTTGTAMAIVLKTGANTEFGKISRNLNQKEDESGFIEGIKEFSTLILQVTFVVVLMVFLINSILKHDILESFLLAVAVAVGLTPELLPMILSVTMSIGSVRMSKKGVIVKKLMAIPNFGSMDILCTDKTGTLTEDKIVLVKYIDIKGKESQDVLINAYLNSHYQTGIKSPLDDAVLKYEKISTVKYRKIDEIPFDFFRKRLSVVVENEKERFLICKGAPEAILNVCKNCSNKNKILVEYKKLSAEGYRVLAVAKKTIKNQKHIYEVKDEKDLTLLGFIAFLDPPKFDVKETLKNIANSGVKIKIITGDNELVTQKICSELDIEISGILFGAEISSMTDDALKVSVEKNTIFARFSPDEKNRIINALKSNGHIVGYMGDGINDAPSLKAANVGISVENAVDIAKESADIVLTHKNLKELLEGILEGRKTFGNSMKYIMMSISSNFGNMFSIIGAVIFLPYMPMLPIQILLNNLMYDFSQLPIPNDKVDDEYVTSPKHWDISFIKKFMIVFGLISSIYDFITFYVLYAVFNANAATFQTGWFIESLATQTLIIHIIRTKKTPFIESTATASLIFGTLLVVILGAILPYTSLGKIFGFSPLSSDVLFAISIIVIAYLITVEIGKRIFYRYVKTAT